MTDLRLWLTRAAPGTARPLGRQLLRLAVARTAQVSPDALGRAVRSCLYCDDPQHGPPRWPGSGVWASVSRAGPVVLVAAVRSPAAGTEHGLGADVVAGTARHAPRPVDLLSCEERRTGLDDGDPLLLWARKEAAVKATGLGLALPVRLVRVAGVADRPGWWEASLCDGAGEHTGRGGAPRRVAPRRLLGTDVDVSPAVGGRHHAAVALAADAPVTVVVSDATELLGRP